MKDTSWSSWCSVAKLMDYREFFFHCPSTKVFTISRNSSVTDVWQSESIFCGTCCISPVKGFCMHYLHDWLSENLSEWSEQGFTLTNPQLGYSSSWCSNTRHVCSQISSWRVAAVWDLPALFFPPPAQLKECSWPRDGKLLWEGFSLAVIDIKCLQLLSLLAQGLTRL